MYGSLASKPIRLYKNIDEFKAKRSKHMGFVRCFKCHGTGHLVAPGEFNDPVEGYKMANLISCPLCKGSKAATEHEINAQYDKWREYYKASIEKWKDARKMYLTIKKKLTKDELSFINFG